MQIRPAVIADADSIAILHVTARRETYRGILSDGYLDHQPVAEHAERWRGFLGGRDCRVAYHVALDRVGNIVGFGACGPQRQPVPSFDGEIYGLYVLRRAQGEGLGGALMGAMARSLRGIGARSISVEVARDNLPARRFYRSLGGELLSAGAEWHFGRWIDIFHYGWRDLAGLCRR